MRRASLTRSRFWRRGPWALLAGLLWIASAWAAGFEVLQASTRLEGGVYRLSARFEYHFSAPALEALQNGVPLTIKVEMNVLKRRPWLWDETVYTLAQRFRLEYHALSRQYLATNLNSGERRGFRSQAAALEFLGKIDDFPFLDSSLLKTGEHYEGALRVELDIEALPAPLRLFAYLSEDWRFTSEWYTWPL